MKINTSFSVISAFLVIFLLQDSSACKCAERNTTVMFCGAQFVSRISLLKIEKQNHTSDSFSWESYLYTVKHEQIFKNSSRLSRVKDLTKIHSAVDPAACGVKLDLKSGAKNEYIVSGYVHGTDLFTHRCQWHEKWKKVPKNEKNDLKNGEFKKRCENV